MGSNKYGHDKKKELRLELSMIEEVEEDGPLPPELYDRKIDVNVELHELLVSEEIFWVQQSHERWLLKGDRKTDYFHKIAIGRKRKNSIHTLKCGDVEIEGTDNLLAHATAYYKELFGPAPRNKFSLDPTTWNDDERLDDIDNADLTREFTEAEVKAALFDMDGNRASGPDNITAEFYQSCWDTVKKDIMNIFDSFHKGELDI